MVFSSPLFLFCFLPIVLTVYFVLSSLQSRNLWLLVASLIFYTWGEVAFIPLLLVSTFVNYLLGLWVDRSQGNMGRKTAVSVAIAVNIGMLAFFKYGTLTTETINTIRTWLHLPPLSSHPGALPIGISFFTFHAISYVVDIYRKKWGATKDPKELTLYIFFFPQLVAGPILRWNAIAPQLIQRSVSVDQFADGIRRFTGGLAKKMLIANALALPADQIFALPPGELSTPVAWFGISCYTLQIYFDFSGYSDMAIGLGKMFGFNFLENFNYPYTSKTIKDFWRRWHISLSSWFRDYVYIPLGGNRVSATRNYTNLITVFFLCGLWHGANWTFVIWGLYHGLFLVIENTRIGAILEKTPRALNHTYAILVIMMGWVIFRSDSVGNAQTYFSSLAGFGSYDATQPLARYATNEAIWAIALGIVFMTPAYASLRSKLFSIPPCPTEAYQPKLKNRMLQSLEVITTIGLLVICAAWLAAGTYNPFIYFRF